MSAELVVPIHPDNLRHQDNRVPMTSDVFNICERIKEIDPNLYIYALDPPVLLGDRVLNYSICEICRDGVERLVMRVNALDARIIEHLEYLLRVPFEQRFAEAERRADKIEADAREAELDKLYEEVGAPMLPLLERTGFMTRRSSYAKRGVTGGRGSLRR